MKTQEWKDCYVHRNTGIRGSNAKHETGMKEFHSALLPAPVPPLPHTPSLVFRHPWSLSSSDPNHSRETTTIILHRSSKQIYIPSLNQPSAPKVAEGNGTTTTTINLMGTAGNVSFVESPKFGGKENWTCVAVRLFSPNHTFYITEAGESKGRHVQTHSWKACVPTYDYWISKTAFTAVIGEFWRGLECHTSLVLYVRLCHCFREPRVEAGANSGTLPVWKNMERIFVNKKQTVSTLVWQAYLLIYVLCDLVKPHGSRRRVRKDWTTLNN